MNGCSYHESWPLLYPPFTQILQRWEALLQCPTCKVGQERRKWTEKGKKHTCRYDFKNVITSTKVLICSLFSDPLQKGTPCLDWRKNITAVDMWLSLSIDRVSFVVVIFLSNTVTVIVWPWVPRLLALALFSFICLPFCGVSFVEQLLGYLAGYFFICILWW